MKITVNVNGQEYTRDVEPRRLLVHFLRDELGLTGTHWGCDTSNCGVCTVLLDDVPVKSCTVLAVMAHGHAIRTVEGLERDGQLDPVQQGFVACHGLQCGFCTPGFLMTLKVFLAEEPDPTEEQVRDAISGNLCRCTGYQNIVDAALDAARAMRSQKSGVRSQGSGTS
jgi:aerobic carbon-monoxide dehydrogenase small subunit